MEKKKKINQVSSQRNHCRLTNVGPLHFKAPKLRAMRKQRQLGLGKEPRQTARDVDDRALLPQQSLQN